MLLKRRLFTIILVILAALVATTAVYAFGGGGLWLSAGQDRANTRYQSTESKLSPDTVGDMVQKWVLNTGGDVSATPAVDGEAVYFPDFAGNLYKVDRDTGEVIWTLDVPDFTGIPGNFARATPAIYEGMLFIGDQGGRQFAGARMMAIDSATGNPIWTTVVDAHPGAIITQSASVFDGVVYVGVASFEEALAGFVPGYQCCSFRGSMVALDAYTGQMLWKTYMAPENYMAPDGYSGNAVWGSSPVVDVKRKTIYIATGNNYNLPQDVLDCISAAGDDNAAQFACLDAGNFFDAVVALDMTTGAVKWATNMIPFDAWTVACIFSEFGGYCPDPEGPDFDFGQAPILYKAKVGGKNMDLLGVGQKSGQFWTLNAETGQILWSTQVGPGGVLGGIMWGSAYDGERIYTSNANSMFQPWTLVDGSSVFGGFWSALDPVTGEILWQTANPTGFPAMGAVSAANGVVYGCSMDPEGHMYALDGSTGEILWDFVSGGSCNAGAAIVNGTVYWGSGYGSLGEIFPYTANDQFYAFELP